MGPPLSVLTPVYDVDQKEALVKAFFNVQLFKRVYEDFKGKELPPEFGMKNALRHQYGVVSKRIELAYRMLMESAEQARFFETRNGAKTHLILPALPSPPGPASPARSSVSETRNANESIIAGGNGGSGGDDGGKNSPEAIKVRTAPTGSMADVKARYLESLIKLFEEKSAKGDLDEKLMERIERLLEA